MATIDKPFRRLIGDLTPLYWGDKHDGYVGDPASNPYGQLYGDGYTGADGYGSVIIDGYAADFAAVMGGEQITVNAYLLPPYDGFSVTTRTLANTDITPELVADKINNGVLDIMGPNGGVAVTVIHGDRLRLTRHGFTGSLGYGRISITISHADFLKIGLPQVDIDPTVAVPYLIPDCTTADASDLTLRKDMISLPYIVPTGATKIGITVKLTRNDSYSAHGVRVLFGWSKDEGNPEHIFDIVVPITEDAAITTIDARYPFVEGREYVKVNQIANVGLAGFSCSTYREMQVPMGYTKFYCTGLGQFEADVSDPLPARLPPKFEVFIQAAAGE